MSVLFGVQVPAPAHSLSVGWVSARARGCVYTRHPVPVHLRDSLGQGRALGTHLPRRGTVCGAGTQPGSDAKALLL